MSSSSNQLVARVAGVSKCYRIYPRPLDRLLNAVFPFVERHEDHWALQDISFEVNRGEAIGVVGRNGSGKSTLLQILAGTLDATAGEFEVRGRVAALLELGAGFNPEFTGRQNVELSAALYGIGRAQQTRTRQGIARESIKHLSTQKVGSKKRWQDKTPVEPSKPNAVQLPLRPSTDAQKRPTSKQLDRTKDLQLIAS